MCGMLLAKYVLPTSILVSALSLPAGVLFTSLRPITEVSFKCLLLQLPVDCEPIVNVLNIVRRVAVVKAPDAVH